MQSHLQMIRSSQKQDKHVIKKHSAQTLESFNEEEDSYESDDEILEDDYSKSEEDEDDYLNNHTRASNKRSKKHGKFSLLCHPQYARIKFSTKS